MTTVSVLGGTGVLGRRIVRRLTAEGATLRRIAVRLPIGRRSGVEVSLHSGGRAVAAKSRSKRHFRASRASTDVATPGKHSHAALRLTAAGAPACASAPSACPS